jgi:hypothetical protein
MRVALIRKRRLQLIYVVLSGAVHVQRKPVSVLYIVRRQSFRRVLK